MDKKFNLIWQETAEVSGGSPHTLTEVMDCTGSVAFGELADKLDVGETLVDPDGDTWERIA